MHLPQSYVPHLDHRITVLLSFTVRRDAGFFTSNHGEPKEFGDLYRGSLEGAGIMLRMLLEFLGVKAKSGIWDRCYYPEAITVHRDLFGLLKDGKWEGIPFRPATSDESRGS